MKGCNIIVESLKKEGVDTIFGYPGGAIMAIDDALMDEKEIHYILARHEQGATHEADGYARATGKVGVVLATSGPGATNTITGIATAYMDSIPLVVLTGQVPTTLIGNDAFQEADTVGISRPCTKHNFLVKNVSELARTIKEAFYIAKSGKPGPVLIDLPKDVILGESRFVYPKTVELSGYNPTTKGNPHQIEKVAKALLKSKKPLLYIGGGAISSNASGQIAKLANRLQIPAFVTLMGQGVFDPESELLLGMAGMHGTYSSNMAIQNCDFLFSLGARFDDRITGKLDEFAAQAKIAHIDVDPVSIGKNVTTEYPIVGDLKIVLNQILEVVERIAEPVDFYKSKYKKWLETVNRWKTEHRLDYKKSPDVIKPQQAISCLSDILAGKNPIIAVGVGQHQMWAPQYMKLSRPRSFLTSGGLGTMGYGLPAAIGAQTAYRDRIVVDIDGDGSFQMNIQELATIVQEKLKLKIMIINNRYLGMVRQWQNLFFNNRYAHTDMTFQPDFVKVANAYGIEAGRVSKPDELDKAVRTMVEYDGAYLLDVVVDRLENVYPMVPSGAPLDRMILV